MTSPSLWQPKELARAVGGRWLSKPGKDWVCGAVTQWIAPSFAGHVLVTRNPHSWDKRAPDEARIMDQAVSMGLACAIIQKEQLQTIVRTPSSFPLLLVKSTRAALKDMAVASRNRFAGKVVAVTGSVGKTTSREMLRHVFEPHGVEANKNNNNNLVGVQKAMASTPQDHGFCVVEMGFGRPLDGLARNSRQVRPHVSLITTVGPAHLDMFTPQQLAQVRGVELIARAKAQMFEGMEKGGFAVLGRDHDQYETLANLARKKGLEVHSFGRSDVADARITELESTAEGSRFRAQVDGHAVELRVGIPGEHMAVNALGVLVATTRAGIAEAEAIERISTFEAVGGRARVLDVPIDGGAITLIDDHFNATPDSMASGMRVLQLVARDKPGRRIAVLGDVMHLGPDAAQIHAGLASAVERHDVDLLFADGPLMRHMFEAVPADKRGAHTEDVSRLYAALRETLQPGDVVLVKSGRGQRGLGDIEFRNIVEHLQRGEPQLVINPPQLSST